MLVFKRVMQVALIAVGLDLVSLPSSDADAHTTTIGYTNAGAGAVSFWYGSYHQGVPFNEGQINLTNGNSYNSTVYFNLLTSTKPTGLVDGTNNFYSTGAGLTGTPTRAIYSWQGATFTGLSAGTYTFTYVPFPANQPNPNQGGALGPTAEWDPWAPDVLSNTIFLNATIVNGNSIANNALTDNQSRVAGALDAANAAGTSGAGTVLLGNVLALDPAGQRNALVMLSGVGNAAAGSTANGAAQTVLSTVAGRTGVLLTEVETLPLGPETTAALPPAYAAVPPASQALGGMKSARPMPGADPRWGSWVVFSGNSGSSDGDPVQGSLRTYQHSWAGTGGFDYRITPDTVVGLALGGSQSNYSVAEALTNGKIDGFQVSLYGVQKWGDTYATARALYGRFDVDIQRTIVGVGPTETTSGSTMGDAFGFAMEVGHIFRFPMANLTPFVDFSVSSYKQQAYTETSTVAGAGAGILGLSVASQTTVSMPAQLGLAIDRTFDISSTWKLVPQLKASWVHDFRGSSSSTASLQSLPGFGFHVVGANAPRDSAKLVSTVSLRSTTGAEIYATGDALLASSSKIYGGKVGVRFSW